jgi:predicted RNase H-like nuclease (RuvC/YqgF family)
MRLFLNWIFQLYEILKQIIIVLEGITVINFIYNNFIKQQKSENNEQLTIDLYNEQHFENIINDLTYKLVKEKEHINELNSKLKNEEIKNFTLRCELVKEKEHNNELNSSMGTKNMNLKLDNLRCNLTREKRINDELKCELTKQSRMNDALKSKLSISEYTLSVVRRINNGLKHN